MDRDCVPAIPKPRKRRGESGAGIEPEGVSLLQFAGPSTASGPPPKFDPPRQAQSDDVAERGSLLARHDLSHTDSKSFVALFAQSLGNVAVSHIPSVNSAPRRQRAVGLCGVTEVKSID